MQKNCFLNHSPLLGWFLPKFFTVLLVPVIYTASIHALGRSNVMCCSSSSRSLATEWTRVLGTLLIYQQTAMLSCSVAGCCLLGSWCFCCLGSSFLSVDWCWPVKFSAPFQSCCWKSNLCVDSLFLQIRCLGVVILLLRYRYRWLNRDLFIGDDQITALVHIEIFTE